MNIKILNCTTILLLVVVFIFWFNLLFIQLSRQQPGVQPHTPPPHQRGGRGGSGGGHSGGGRRGNDSGRGRSRYNPY